MHLPLWIIDRIVLAVEAAGKVRHRPLTVQTLHGTFLLVFLPAFLL